MRDMAAALVGVVLGMALATILQAVVPDCVQWSSSTGECVAKMTHTELVKQERGRR